MRWCRYRSRSRLESFRARTHAQRNLPAAVTPLAQLPFFMDYLPLSGLDVPWVSECPLTGKSSNASRTEDVLGTVMRPV